MQDIPIALVMYDIMCQYRVNFQDRVKDSPHLSLPSSSELWTGIGLFHIHGHQDSCLPRYSPNYIPGAKQVDGEMIETLWAPLNNISRSIRGMSLSHRQEVLDAHMNHSNWKKLVRNVPSLLKRWRCLGDGLEASSKAYKALSEHFQSKTAQWLKEDKQAQKDRQTIPSSMDIYDTLKQKAMCEAPSQADIQTQLIMEEQEEHSIHGQTSWIQCGLKIQEMQLTLRYQLWSGGSHVTLEEPQVIENKRVRLQKLIDMFEHQADGFLLHHGPMDDMPIPSLADYAEYDHIDDIDDSGVTVMIPHTSNPPFGEGPHSEDIPILLPLTLGCQCYAQATDSIHAIRLALGFKSAMFRTQVRGARTQQTKTRAWTAIKNVDTTVHQHARNYGMARDAYEKIKDMSQTSLELPALAPANLQVNTTILGAEQRGQRNKQLSWIWSFGISSKKDETWMDEFNRVHWLHAKAQFERWEEEEDSVHNEADWIPAYFHAQAECWKR
ncbi:hypothetical protein EI94DRAFT_1708367 [Lactarius quietus]|nr:hypothetical protein EI94DRAFT_1708367 [Lactarius quietus]